MACNDTLVFINQDRIREPNFLDAGRDLAHLLVGMDPGDSGRTEQGHPEPDIRPGDRALVLFSDPFRGILEPFRGVWGCSWKG